jgi:hypothetical protein
MLSTRVSRSGRCTFADIDIDIFEKLSADFESGTASEIALQKSSSSHLAVCKMLCECYRAAVRASGKRGEVRNFNWTVTDRRRAESGERSGR